MNEQTQIGHYRMVRKLGEGGMAEVWQALNLRLGTTVAIKFLLPAPSSNAALERRFLEEGRRQASLRHQNIVPALDFLEQDGHSYLVMEYIDGESLDTRLRERQAPLRPEEVHSISWDVLSALDYAHSQNVVHRDVKPSNILLSRNGHALLTDFGIALAMSGGQRLTRTGALVGTAMYMSPEQILRPRDIDRRTDIYSFGCVLYAMLTGSPPFGNEGETEYSIQDCHVHAAPPPLRSRNPRVSPAVELVVLRCLEKDPAARFQTCGSVMSALDAAMAGRDVQESKSRETRRDTVVQPAIPVYRPVEENVPGPVSGNSSQGGSYGGDRFAGGSPSGGDRFFGGAAPGVPAGGDRFAAAAASGGVQQPLVKKKTGLWIALGAFGLVLAAAIYLFFFLPPETILRLEGSTTVGDELAPALVKSFLATQNATEIRDVPASGANKEHHDIEARLPGHWRKVLVSILANGSGNAFTALDSGRADLGMASRAIKADEVRTLSRLGDMKSPASENIIGLDGIAVIVNRENQVPPLTRQQLNDIFSGKITDWAQVGAPAGPVHLFGRDQASGTFDTFVSLVMDGKKNGFASGITVLDNGDEIARRVAQDRGAIGYVGLAQVGGASALELAAVPGATPLLPSQFTVSTEDYILSRRLYLYAPASATEMARKFLDYAATADGQKVVKRIGFVEQTPHSEEAGIPANAPANYRTRVAGLKRMSLNFRFRPNSTELDNKALADLPRAVATLSQNGISSGVQVLGFADSRGTPAQNQTLSDQRAEVVAQKLRAYGIGVEAAGFSSALPVGDNNTADGRDKNRRVELWTR